MSESGIEGHQDVEAQHEDQDDQAATRWRWRSGDVIVPGRFVVERLGGGSEYEAYLAWDERMLSLVVAKCLRPHRVADPDSLRRLRREAELLLNLRHPVVVRGYAAVLDGDHPHVVEEHLEGLNLASLLHRYGRLDLEQLLPLTLQVCSALHYLAQERLVHLDVKPRNIIMGGPPRLIDFSVARSFEDALAIRGHIGTDPYMAPEQCDLGRAPIGAPADVWGLGATLYHALAGEVPFPRGKEAAADSAPLEQRFPQISQPPPPLPARVPETLKTLVADCMAPDPDSRPSPAEVVERIEPVLATLRTKPVLRRLRPRVR